MARRSMGLSLCGMAAVLCFTGCKGAAGGCESDKDCKGDRLCQQGQCVDPSLPERPAGVAAGSVNKPSRASADGEGKALPAFATRTIEDGFVADGSWSPSFSFRRETGDEGRSYLEAFGQCSSKGLALCTETQWVRACMKDAAIGAVESWTASAVEGQGFVVRGGPAGCSGRQIVPASSQASTRVGACCDRAVGIRTTNKNIAFLKTSAQRMLDYERALGKKDVAALGKLYDGQVRFFSRDFALDALMKESQRYFNQYPTAWIVYDVCDTSIEKGEDPKLVSECLAVSQRSGELAVVIQKLVRGGPETRIQQLTEPKTFRKFSPP